ncbi:ribosome biogenesis protein SLX9-domain-containing protein [Fomes fomentarius]|nr:ribosome biogenesis protein SLX9-domain-containing protein [Fomes fomentarius]
MPKEKRRRSGAHEQSVRLSRTHHACNYGHGQAPEILADMAAEEDARPALKKKEKQALKHELFMQRLEQSRSPYSKSHERRLKRKAREQVAGGMDEIKMAIAAVEDDIPLAVQNSIAATAEGVDETPAPQSKKVRPKHGQIGEGKGAPLTKNQRKRALQVERMRIPMILATPEFAANPFQTIRTHAQNTLLKHEPPAAA